MFLQQSHNNVSVLKNGCKCCSNRRTFHHNCTNACGNRSTNYTNKNPKKSFRRTFKIHTWISSKSHRNNKCRNLQIFVDKFFPLFIFFLNVVYFFISETFITLFSLRNFFHFVCNKLLLSIWTASFASSLACDTNLTLA